MLHSTMSESQDSIRNYSSQKSLPLENHPSTWYSVSFLGLNYIGDYLHPRNGTDRKVFVINT